MTTLQAYRSMKCVQEPLDVEAVLQAYKSMKCGQEPLDVEAVLILVWWFVENVSQDDPDRDEIFFDLRSLVRLTLED